MAEPITYTATLFGVSGSLGSVSFSGPGTRLEVTFRADTSTVIPYGPSPAPIDDRGFENLAGFASVRISDGGAELARADFLSQAQIFVGVDNTVVGLAVGSAGVPPDDPTFPGTVGYPFGMQAFGVVGVDTYDLTTDFDTGSSSDVPQAFSCVGPPLFDVCAAPVPLPTTAGELRITPVPETGNNQTVHGRFAAKTGTGAGVGSSQFVFASAVGAASPATSATEFNVPMGMTMSVASAPGSLSGTIYVADPFNDQVVAFNPDGSTSTFSALTCPASMLACSNNTWQLMEPTFVAAAPDGNIWISDTGNDVVVEMDPMGQVVGFAGRGPDTTVYGCTGGCGTPPHPNAGDGPGQFFGPGPLAVDGLTGELFVADWAGSALIVEDTSGHDSNVRIQKFTSGGTFVTSWGSLCALREDGSVSFGNCDTNAPGAQALGDGEFGQVTGLAVDNSGHVYTVDQGLLTRVQKFDGNGTFVLKWTVSSPGGIAVDLDQTVYVAEKLDHRIEQFDGNGGLLSRGGSQGAGQMQFDGPFGIAAIPPAAAFLCVFGGDSDCIHGFVVSESGNHHRVQLVAARPDTDNDGLTNELDLAPGVFSNDFSNASLGFTTTGRIVERGDVSAVVHAVETPASDDVRIRTDTFGGPKPLKLSFCNPSIEATLSPGNEAVVHCSTPTVVAELGPFTVRFTGADGTTSTATLQTGDSLSLDPAASALLVNAGTIAVDVGGHTVALAPGQSVPVLTPTANPTATPTGGAAPLTVAFQANASDALSDPLSYAWTFGDPASSDDTSTAANPTHVYAAPGTFNVQLTVSNGGIAVTRTLGITVLTVTKLVYTGASFLAKGAGATLSALLTAADGSVIAGVPVSLALGSGTGAQSCTGVTDARGKATCVISSVSQPLGPAAVVATFGGDAARTATSVTANVIVYANLSKGAFVIGDRSDSGAVTFWSSQWSKANGLSGGSAPAQFKGFADQVTTPPQCGTTWTSQAGGASCPPATVPAYLGVIVSSSISGRSQLAGTTQAVAIIKTDPGYGPAPGQRGTGTVLGVICP